MPLRDRSTFDLTKAIRSPTEESKVAEKQTLIRERARIAMKLGYQPEETHEERALFIEEYVKALEDYPKWACEAAFEKWMRTSARRPSPSEIVLLASRALEPLTRELAQRERARNAAPAQRRTDMSHEDAARISAQAGYTPRRFEAVKNRRMVHAEDLEGDVQEETQPHWSEGLDEEDPRMERLRRARADNPLMQEAREVAERHRPQPEANQAREKDPE